MSIMEASFFLSLRGNESSGHVQDEINIILVYRYILSRET